MNLQRNLILFFYIIIILILVNLLFNINYSLAETKSNSWWFMDVIKDLDSMYNSYQKEAFLKEYVPKFIKLIEDNNMILIDKDLLPSNNFYYIFSICNQLLTLIILFNIYKLIKEKKINE